MSTFETVHPRTATTGRFTDKAQSDAELTLDEPEADGPLTLIVDGRRVWVEFDYQTQVKNRVKALGSHWDPDSRRRWASTQNLTQLEELNGELAATLAAADAGYQAGEYARFVKWQGGLAMRGRGLAQGETVRVRRSDGATVEKRVGQVIEPDDDGFVVAKVGRREATFGHGRARTQDSRERALVERYGEGAQVFVNAPSSCSYGGSAGLENVWYGLSRDRDGGLWVVLDTKTERTHYDLDDEWVDVPDFLIPPLQARLSKLRPDDLVFTTVRDNQIRLTTWRERYFDRAVSEVNAHRLEESADTGEPADVIDAAPHDLRHSAVSFAVAEGADVKVIQ